MTKLHVELEEDSQDELSIVFVLMIIIVLLIMFYMAYSVGKVPQFMKPKHVVSAEMINSLRDIEPYKEFRNQLFSSGAYIDKDGNLVIQLSKVDYENYCYELSKVSNSLFNEISNYDNRLNIYADGSYQNTQLNLKITLSEEYNTDDYDDVMQYINDIGTAFNILHTLTGDDAALIDISVYDSDGNKL